MRLPEFSTVVGVDAEHIEQLRLVWPTWRAHRPQLLRHPLILICDDEIDEAEWHRQLSFLDHPNKRLVRWHMDGVAQREKMLTGLVFATAQHVDTPWYLKLDTDAVAVAPGDWLQPAWFAQDGEGRLPVFISSPWGYTKPPDAIDRLDEWARTIPELADYPDLRIHPRAGWRRVRHPRIISWCFFGLTGWTREVSHYCQDRLPLASQDTYLWYCAERRGDFYRRVRMRNFGWAHVRSTRKIARLCQAALLTG